MSKHNQGQLFMISGICMYIVSDAIIKHFLSIYDIHQITFMRTISRFVPFTIMMLCMKINPLQSQKKSEHIFRAIIASCITYCFMGALKYASMTDVAVMGYTTAIFILPLSAIILREKLYIKNTMFVIIGFVGILIALRPEASFFHSGITIAMIGAFLSALNQIIIRKLSFTEQKLTIIFYHHIVLLLCSAILGWHSFCIIKHTHLFALALSGIIGAFAQYFITHALSLSKTSSLAASNYATLIPIILIDLFFWNKIPDIYVIIGSVLIIISNYNAYKSR